MDNQIIFVRTSKGENELHGAAALLAGDIKRALLMIDGVATLADIEKHSAPSLRAVLPGLINELQSKGFIEDKSRLARVPKLVIPSKPTGEIAPQAVNEFDFTAAYRAPTADILAAEAEKEAKLAAKLKEKQEVVRHLQAEKSAAQALEEAERAKKQAVLEAQARAEAERRAKELAELARLKEQAIAQARAELEAAKAVAKAEAEARAAAELKAKQAAELRARQEAEIEKLKAKQVMLAKAQAEEKAALVAAMKLKERQAAELAELRAEQEKVKQIAERQAKEIADRQSNEMARTVNIRIEPHQMGMLDGADARSDKTDPNLRTTTVTVLFFDMVAYTKQAVQKQTEMKKLFNQLVSDCLKSVSDDRNEYIILDTGDGAAIGFTHHPEEALEVSMKFRDAIISNEKYKDLKVRMGIHLGPINIMVDMNGKPNMVGNGINDAQRVMDFAGENQIFISRSYYDFVSRLSDEYAEQFYYRGAQKDKHGHEHQVYALNSRMRESSPPVKVNDAPTSQISLAPFTFSDPKPVPVQESSLVEASQFDDADLQDFIVPELPESFPPSENSKSSPTAAEMMHVKELKQHDEDEAKRKVLMAEIEAQKRADAQAAEAKKLAEMQAKAWAQAERRAMEAAKVNAERAVQQAASASVESVVKAQHIETLQRKPFPWKKMFVSLLVLSLVAFGVALYVAPMLMPMDEYERKTELFLTERLQQPVHVGKMHARLIPTPQVTFDDFFMGKTNQIRAQRVAVNFAPLTLFSSQKMITDVELTGFKMTGEGLKVVGNWLESVASDAAYPIQKITFKDARFETEAFQKGGIEGQFIFNTAGRLMLTDFREGTGQFSVSITAMGGHQEVKLSVRNAAMPFLPNLHFDELHATGDLEADRLNITQLDASIAQGFLSGNMNVTWQAGWLVQGMLKAESLDLKNINRHLVGDVDGSGRLKMQHTQFKGLTETATLAGIFEAKKGVIQGVDLVEILRTRGREKAVGGQTKFDVLTGSFAYSPNHYEFQQLKLRKGDLNATAQVTLDHTKTLENNKVVERDNLLGRIDATLDMQGEHPAISVKIEGTPEQFSETVL
ncbi:MAG: adenylate/guanylate cyclase domain-containing protein [Gallionella sp.]|nr:adenylate/guanylate cyclase domain-containing protein [Gallionella sp.]